MSILRTDFEAHGLEGFNFPAIGKGMTQLGLRDASRSFHSRSGVAKTKQEQTRARIEDVLEPAHVANAIGVGKNAPPCYEGPFGSFLAVDNALRTALAL